jgi:hypothetical protein
MTLLLLTTAHQAVDEDDAEAPLTDVTRTTVLTGRTLVTTGKGATDG